MDGNKGIRKAVEEVLGTHALIQRCQWHKRENVLEHLPKGEKLPSEDAYRRPTRNLPMKVPRSPRKGREGTLPCK